MAAIAGTAVERHARHVLRHPARQPEKTEKTIQLQHSRHVRAPVGTVNAIDRLLART
jgi:hypothetical protein